MTLLERGSAPDAGDGARSAPGLTDTVRRARDGDADAFAELYRAHAGRIYALCLRLEGDAVRAEELTQDVFVRAWERLASYRGASAFSTWLHRLAVNVVLGDRRSTWRRGRRVLVTDDLGAFESAAAGAASRDDAGTDAGAMAIDLEQAIAALPPGARTVFVLHDIEGYRHEEIAEMAGIAEGTSKTQLFRARRMLREALGR